METFQEVIGIDESGKGDYFGPLVTAGVFVSRDTALVLEEQGVRDSKKVSDGKAKELARVIRGTCPFEIVAVGPERYNALYAKMKNLNRLLAWCHARVLENLLERVPCTRALCDQFGDERLILNALMDKGRRVRLEQRVRAEENVAVAAASLLARAEFLRRLEALSGQYGLRFPKGAGAPVDQAGMAFIERFGAGDLTRVAKVHFRTTKKILPKGD